MTTNRTDVLFFFLAAKKDGEKKITAPSFFPPKICFLFVCVLCVVFFLFLFFPPFFISRFVLFPLHLLLGII